MTEKEAIERLTKSAYRTTCYGNKVVEHEEYLVAIQALEKQIAKKPILINGGFTGVEIPCCPCCSTPEHYRPLWDKVKYCSNCGQKLDWSDLNECKGNRGTGS